MNPRLLLGMALPLPYYDYTRPPPTFADYEGTNRATWSGIAHEMVSESARVQTQGVVIWPPNIPLARASSCFWRQPFEWRELAAKEDSPLANRNDIVNATVLLNQHAIPYYVYAGVMNERMCVPAEAPYVAGAFDFNFGPFMAMRPAGVCLDTIGDYQDRYAPLHRSIRTRYPWLKLGAEPWPQAGPLKFDFCLTIRASIEHVPGRPGLPGPNMLWYNSPTRKFNEEEYSDIINQMNAGFCCVVQSHQVDEMHEKWKMIVALSQEPEPVDGDPAAF